MGITLTHSGATSLLTRTLKPIKLLHDRRTVPGGPLLAPGDARHPALAWDSVLQAWAPTATTRYSLLGITRSRSYAAIAACVQHQLDNGNRQFPPYGQSYDPSWEPFAYAQALSLVHGDGSEPLYAPWEDGGDAPYAWMLFTHWQGYAPNYDIEYSPATADPNAVYGNRTALPDTVELNFLRIGGVAFDLVRSNGRLPGGRPVADEYAQFFSKYTAPAAPALVVTPF